MQWAPYSVRKPLTAWCCDRTKAKGKLRDADSFASVPNLSTGRARRIGRALLLPCSRRRTFIRALFVRDGGYTRDRQ